MLELDYDRGYPSGARILDLARSRADRQV